MFALRAPQASRPLIAATLLAASGLSAAAQPATLLHEFSFNNNGAVTTVTTAHTGTLMGGARVADGVLTLAQAGDYVIFQEALVPLADDHDLSSWSVSAWVRATAPLSGVYNTFFSAAGDASYFSGMQLSLINDGSPYGRAFAYTSVNFGMSLPDPESFGAGWHHVAAVFSANRGTLYVDGQYANGMDYGDRGDNPAAILNNSVTTFGRAGARLYGAGPEQFIGQLDDIRIYRGGLTELQVRAQYDAGPSPLSAVPEPTSATLALLGLAGLAGLAGCRRRHNQG